MVGWAGCTLRAMRAHLLGFEWGVNGLLPDVAQIYFLASQNFNIFWFVFSPERRKMEIEMEAVAEQAGMGSAFFQHCLWFIFLKIILQTNIILVGSNLLLVGG